jgi:hypothetical protein
MDAGVFFLVHVWCDAAGFHATARDVTREEVAQFDDAAALAAFLSASVSAGGPARAAPAAVTSSGATAA